MDSREGSDEDEDEGSPEDSSDEESDMEVESTTMESKQSVQSTESAGGEVPAVLDNTSSIPEPQQSSARSSPSPGSQAAEQYNFEVSLERALQQECVEVDVLKCVTLGPPGVGKSQLRRALTGSYEEVTESTPVSTGAEVIIEKYMDSEAMWQKFDLWDGQKALVTSVREGDFAEVLPDSPHVVTRSQRSLSSRKQVSEHVELVHNIVKVRARCKKLRETRDNMMKQLQQTDATGQKSLHKARIIHLIDSGGQLSFFDVHATLATSRAAYLQVFNLAKALDSKPRMSYRRTFPTKELYSPFRNIDFVARTFATLHDCKKKFMQMDEMIKTVMSGHKSNDLPIFLIGTHLDKTLSSNEKVSSAIEKECHTFPNWNEVVPNDNLSFYPVSCLPEGHAGIKALQRKISECRGGYPIRLPLSWFFVELMFWSEKGAGDGCMKYSELRDMCVQDKLLQSEDEFFTMVKLFHLLGLFIFPDLDRGLEIDKLDDFPVFTDPNFLFGEVSKILDIQFRTGLSGSLKHLQATGILQEGALGDLGIPTSAGTLMYFHDWFKEFLIMWGLAADVSERRGKAQKLEQAQELFIPSVLPHRPSAKDRDPDVCALLVAFLDDDGGGSYHIPQGIFSHFVAAWLVKDKQSSLAPGVYRDLVSFKNVRRERVTYTVRVREEMDHLAFTLVPESPTKRSTAASYNAIREELLQVLVTVWEHIYRGTPELVVGFRCPCQGKEGSSRDHIANYLEELREVSCSSKLRDGKSMSASLNQLKWFGIHKVERVASAGKENLPYSSSEVLQPVSTNGNSGLLQRQTPLLAHGSTPVAVSIKERSGRFSQPFNDPIQTTLKRCTHTPPHPAAISSGTLSTDQEQPLESRALSKYEERFIEVVAANEIAPGLYRRKVIPQSIMKRIEKSDSDKDSRELLFDHLKQHGNVDSLKAFCEEAIVADGYPNMQNLGRDMKAMLEREGKAVASSEKEKSPSIFSEFSMNGSSPHTSQSQCHRQSSTAQGRMLSSTEKQQKKTTKCSCLPSSHTKWYMPIHSHHRGETQQLNGGSQTVGTQAAHHPSPLQPTHSSSFSPGNSSGGTEEVTCAPLSEPDDSPSDTNMSPPPAKRTKTTHSTSSRSSTSSSDAVAEGSEVPPPQLNMAVGSAGKEKSPSSSSELPLPVSVSTSNSQSCTSQFQPRTLRRVDTAGAGMQSSGRKGKQSSTKEAKQCSRSLTDPRSLLITKYFQPIPSRQDTQQLNGGSQTVGGQAAHHPSPLRPTHSSSSSSFISSGVTEEVTSAPLSEPDMAVDSAGKEKSPSSSSEFLLPVSVSTSNSQPHTSQSQPCNLRGANTAGAGMQSSARKRTEKRSCSLPYPHSLQRGDTQQLNRHSQMVGAQAAHHPSPLRPTQPSPSSPGNSSGGTEQVTSALPSGPDDVPSDTDMAPPPAKKTKPTHSTSGPAGST